jgi:hypothetical protein
MNVGHRRTVQTPTTGRELCRSARAISRELTISGPRVFEVLQNDQLKPYHYSQSARLFPDDPPVRIEFCGWLRHQHAADELFLHNIRWSDEAYFTREGAFNVHSRHLWTQDNPHPTHERGYEVCFSSSLWAGTVGDIVVGPCLLTDQRNTIVSFLKLFYRDCLSMCF